MSRYETARHTARLTAYKNTDVLSQNIGGELYWPLSVGKNQNHSDNIDYPPLFTTR